MKTRQIRAASFGLMFIIMGCGYESAPIHFVVPSGFTGAIVIAQVEGYDMGFERTNGGYRYAIPRSGILCVASYSPFQRPFRLTAQYADGQTIYTNLAPGVPPPPGAESIRVEALGQRGYSRQDPGDPKPRDWPMEAWFVVGTEVQVEEAQRQKNTFLEGFDVRRCQGVDTSPD